MMISSAGRAAVATGVLLLAACPHPPIKSAATVRPEELTQSPDDLLKRSAALEQKTDSVSLENALVLSDKALEVLAPVGAPANPQAYDAASRGAEISFWLADLAEDDKNRRQTFAEKGMGLARRAIDLNGKGAEGHYYLALNTAYLARTKTVGALGLLPDIVKEARAAMAINDKVDHCGPLRLLGTVLLRAPSWPTSVGDVDEAKDALQKAAESCPEHPGNHLFYGEALIANKKREQAAPELEKALATPTNPDWAKMEARIRVEATEQLAKIRK